MFIKKAENMPEFLTQGLTYLWPKSGDTVNTANYR